MAKSKIQQWESEAKVDGMRSLRKPKSQAYYDNFDRIFKQGKYAPNKKHSRT